MKSRSREIGCYNDPVALKYDRHLGGASVDIPVKFQGDRKIWNWITRLRDFTRSCSKMSYHLVNRGPGYHQKWCWSSCHETPQTLTSSERRRFTIHTYLTSQRVNSLWPRYAHKGRRTRPPLILTSSNGNIFHVTGPLCGEFTGDRRRGDLMFSLICTWINAWVNNREAGDLRRHRAHYDDIVMGLDNSIPHIYHLHQFGTITMKALT